MLKATVLEIAEEAIDEFIHLLNEDVYQQRACQLKAMKHVLELYAHEIDDYYDE